jgi:hypothetical protein
MVPNIEVKLVEWFDNHWYKLGFMKDGMLESRYIPSVTSKLSIVDKPFLAKWRGDIGNREADTRLFDSQQRGSRIHDAFNRLVNGQGVVFNPWNRKNYSEDDLKALELKYGGLAVLNYQDEFYQLYKLKLWLDVIKPKILCSEMTVYSLENNDAGTLDLSVHITKGKYHVNGSKTLEIPEGQYIVDLKTGSMVSDEAYLQTAAYLKCAEEMKIGKFEGTIILHTGSKNRGGIEGLGTILRLRDQVEDDYKQYRLAAKLWEWKHKDDQPKIFEMPSILSMSINNEENN